MASSFYINSQHVDFDSVLAMDDQGMVSMFQGLMASDLAGFLGCPAVIYEAALVDFFENASVREGVIISTVAGQLVEISEEWFVESFELPLDGLGDLSEIPKDVFFDARSIVSLSGEPVSLSGGKNQMKIELRLLCDIMAKAISVKAGSFNAITVEKFSLMTAIVCGVRMNWARIVFNTFKKMVTPGSKQAKGFAVQIRLLLENIPNLELGESSEFPASKILTDKTVHRFVSLNDKAGAESATGAPKPKAASKKRRAADVGAAMVAVAQEIVPLQMVEPCPDVPAVEDHVEQPAAEEGISAVQPVAVGVGEVATKIDASADRDKPADTNEESQWFDLTHEELITKWADERIITSPADIDEEIEAEKPVFKSVEAVESVIEIEEAAADKYFLVVDDPDTVINQVLQQLDSMSADKDDKSGTGAETWFDRALDEMLRKDEGAETMDVDTAGGDQQVQCSEEEPVMRKEVKETKRRRAEESADGLALMTSSVTSSYSADGLREQSQESAGSLYIQTQESSDVVEEEIQSQATVHQQMIFGDSDSKTMSST
ncbi:dystroglycan-like [Dorcoceras hygrometricum]|uniref:Dystroglycan-like n=1 Tax=Dorcoceras hygrometricum TaxID=472368 RepID=A0A2Z7CYE7_9LAMI|nr:dystroglycan-like [Dorcoceras hygrometricum]